MNKNKAPTERRLVVSIISFLSDKMFSVSMQTDSDDNCKCRLLYLCPTATSQRRDHVGNLEARRALWRCIFMLPHKKNKRSSSYRRSQVNEWVLSLRTTFHIKLWIVSGGLSIYEYIITHWITCVFWVKKRAVCKSLFVYFGKYYEHVIDNSVYNMQLFMSQISVETLLIIKCTWMFGKQNLFQLRNTWKNIFDF